MSNLNKMTARQLRQAEENLNRKCQKLGMTIEDEIMFEKISDALANREYDILNNRI